MQRLKTHLSRHQGANPSLLCSVLPPAPAATHSPQSYCWCLVAHREPSVISLFQWNQTISFLEGHFWFDGLCRAAGTLMLAQRGRRELSALKQKKKTLETENPVMKLHPDSLRNAFILSSKALKYCAWQSHTHRKCPLNNL